MRRTRTLGSIIVLVVLAAACSTGTDSSTAREGSPTPETLPPPAAMEAEPEVQASADGVVAPPEEPPVDPYADNYFQDYGVNPWVSTADDPQSTFAIDVDTGSYTLGKRWIDQGSLPHPDSVRVEEYVNYFDYGYALPQDSALGIDLAGGRSPFAPEDDVRVLRVGIQATDVDPADRPDADLTFVIDVSGSMDMENRLDLVKDSLRFLVAQLRDSETVAIVVYGDDARVALDRTPVSEADEILAAIDGLETEGSTNAEAGLNLGYEVAASALTDGRINRVVLASDGVANTGASDAETLSTQIRRYADQGIQLVTMGFGMGNYNDTLMEQLADDGDGFYAYADDLTEAQRLFSEDLTGSLLTVALDTKVQVSFDPTAVSEYRLLGFENRDIADEDFQNDAVDAGEVGAGHDMTAVYEIRLAGEGDSDAGLATVDLRWEDPDSHQVGQITETAWADLLSTPWEEMVPSARLATAVAAYAELLRNSELLQQRSITLDQVAHEIQRLEPDFGGDARFDTLVDLTAQAALLPPAPGS